MADLRSVLELPPGPRPSAALIPRESQSAAGWGAEKDPPGVCPGSVFNAVGRLVQRLSTAIDQEEQSSKRLLCGVIGLAFMEN